MSDGGPTVTPSSLVVEKEQVVVIEFRREIPKNSFLTLDIYYEESNSKFVTVPTALLGPRTVRAMFPVFPKPGTVTVTVLLARDEDVRFPQFKLKIKSPIESLVSALPVSRGSKQVALLAAALAYLANCDENDKEATSTADRVLCEILKAIQPADLPEWTLAWLLCGKFSPAENLLHVCTRQKLTQSLDTLLQPWFIEDRAHYLFDKRGPNNKTPVDIAKKHNLVAVTETAEQLLASGAMKVATPKSKKKFALRQEMARASSIDSNLQYLVQDAPSSPAKKNKGKTAKRMFRQLFKSETKDKLVNIPAPQHPPQDEGRGRGSFSGPSDDTQSVTLPRNHRHSTAIAVPPDSSGQDNDNSMTQYSMSGKEETMYEQKRLSRTFPRLEQAPVSPKHMEPLPQAPLPSTPPTNQERLQVTMEHRPRPVSSLSSGYGSAVSNAVADLKEKAIYKAEVIRQYKWESSTHNELVLQVGDKVYVTQEVEDNMCFGVCNDHYCKFPKNILCILSDFDGDDMEDEHDYSRVVLPGASDEEDDDIYKIPRNVPRVASDDSDSDGSDHIYDVPPKREDILNNLIAEGHYMRVPTRNSVLETILSDKLIVEPDRKSLMQDKLSTVVEGISSKGANSEQRAMPGGTVDTRGQNSATKLQQKEREDLPNIAEDSDNDEDGAGIYDVPSSILRSIHEMVPQDPSEYDVLIPISTHSAKIADESQRTQPSKAGWGYADIKDVVPSTPTATSSSNWNHPHSTAGPALQYAELDEAVSSSKRTPFVPRDIQDTPAGKLMEDIYDTLDSEVVASISNSKTVSHDSPRSERKINSGPHPTHYPVANKGNENEKYDIDEVDQDEDGGGIYDVPSAIIRSINDVMVEEPCPQVVDSERRDTERSSDVSEQEETRNTDTPEESEGSDVFTDQTLVAMTSGSQGKANSLPPRSQRNESEGLLMFTTPPQKGATIGTYSPRHARSRISSEPQVSPKPRLARRTKVPLPQDSTAHQMPLSQVTENPQEKTESKLPLREASPPPLPEKPPPVLHEIPPPALPEKPYSVISERPPPALPEKPTPVLPEKPPPELPEKPLPELLEKPLPELPEKPLPALPNEPPFDSPLLPSKPPVNIERKFAPNNTPDLTTTDKTTVGKTSRASSDRPPKPKPRRYVPASKPPDNSQVEVRSGRSHTTATCTPGSVDDSLAHHGHGQTNKRGSPEVFRSKRIKSSSETQSHATGNISSTAGWPNRDRHHSEDNESAVHFRGKAKAPVPPPVARKPKHISPTSSPVINRQEHVLPSTKPPTSPKPRRR